jgi:hypothetical protein
MQFRRLAILTALLMLFGFPGDMPVLAASPVPEPVMIPREKNAPPVGSRWSDDDLLHYIDGLKGKILHYWRPPLEIINPVRRYSA